MNDTQPRSGMTWTMSPDEQVAGRGAGRCRPRSGRRSGSASSRRRGRTSRPTSTRCTGSSRITHSRSASCSSTGQSNAVRPFDHRRVVVRVRDRDRAQPAARRRSRAVASSSSVTQSHSTFARRAGRAAHAGRSRTRGSVPIAGQLALVGGSGCGGRGLHASVDRPLLAATRHVLPRVLADRAMSRGPPYCTPQVTQIG